MATTTSAIHFGAIGKKSLHKKLIVVVVSSKSKI